MWGPTALPAADPACALGQVISPLSLGCFLCTIENCPSSGVRGKWCTEWSPVVTGAVSRNSVWLEGGGVALLPRLQVLFQCVSIGVAFGERLVEMMGLRVPTP